MNERDTNNADTKRLDKRSDRQKLGRQLGTERHTEERKVMKYDEEFGSWKKKISVYTS